MIASLHDFPPLADAAFGPMGLLAQRAAGYWRRICAEARPVLPEELSPDLFGLGHLPRLQMGVTNVCNARCRFCAYPLAAADPQRIPRVLPLDLGREIIARYAATGGRAVDFTAPMGEPLLCPHLCELIAFARSVGITSVSLVTNGTLLHRERRALSILEAGATQVIISAADFDREVYSLMMGTDAFMSFCDGLDDLLRENARRGHPAAIRLCVRNALPPSVTLRSPVFRAIVRPHRRRISLTFTVSFDSWCGALDGSGFIGGMRLRPPVPATDRPCIGLFQPVILPDGQVRLCPCRARGSEYDGLVVGTLDDYADRALAIARGFYRGLRPAPCRDCSMYYPLTHRWLRDRALTRGPSA